LEKLTQAAITNWFWTIEYSPFDSPAHDERFGSKRVHSGAQYSVNCPIKSKPLQREGDVFIMEQAYKLGLSDAE
jgi:hypothetical protein